MMQSNSFRSSSPSEQSFRTARSYRRIDATKSYARNGLQEEFPDIEQVLGLQKLDLLHRGLQRLKNLETDRNAVQHAVAIEQNATGKLMISLQRPLAGAQGLLTPYNTAETWSLYGKAVIRGTLDLKTGLTFVTTIPGLSSGTAIGPFSQIASDKQQNVGIGAVSWAFVIIGIWAAHHIRGSISHTSNISTASEPQNNLERRATRNVNVGILPPLRHALPNHQDVIRHTTAMLGAFVLCGVALGSSVAAGVFAGVIVSACVVHHWETARTVRHLKTNQPTQAILFDMSHIDANMDSLGTSWKTAVRGVAARADNNRWTFGVLGLAFVAAEGFSGWQGSQQVSFKTWFVSNALAGLVTFSDGWQAYNQLVPAAIETAGSNVELRMYRLQKTLAEVERLKANEKDVLNYEIAPHYRVE